MGRQTYARDGDRGGRPGPDGEHRLPRRSAGGVALLLLALLGVTVVLHLPGFSDRVFNSDEAYLATQAQVLDHGGRLYVDTVDRKPPMVPYLYAAVFRVTGGDDLAAVRVVAILAQLVTALLLAFEARRRFRWRHTPLVAALAYLLAAAAFAPADAQAANFEVFMLPLMTGAFVLAVRGRPIASGVSLALATLTKQTAALALLPIAWLLWRARRPRLLVLLGVAFTLPIVFAAVVFGPHDFVHWVFTGNGDYVDVSGALGYALSNGAARTGWFLVGSAALVVLLSLAWRHRRADVDLWLWLASGVVAVMIGFRFFPHYYLQLLPPMALLATRALDALTGNLRSGVLALVAVVAVAVTAWFVVPAFTSSDNRDTRIALAVAAYVARNTPANARVLVWGQAPEVYWKSGRAPATRFATTGFVTGVSGGRAPSRVGSRYAAPGAAELFYRDLRRTPPVLIADMSTADQRHAHFAPPARFPRFERFLRAGGWHRVAVVDGVAILRPGARASG
jgi:Dolichyl-phosphate-mannose-protein mannosyltransferase